MRVTSLKDQEILNTNWAFSLSCHSQPLMDVNPIVINIMIILSRTTIRFNFCSKKENHLKSMPTTRGKDFDSSDKALENNMLATQCQGNIIGTKYEEENRLMT